MRSSEIPEIGHAQLEPWLTLSLYNVLADGIVRTEFGQVGPFRYEAESSSGMDEAFDSDDENELEPDASDDSISLWDTITVFDPSDLDRRFIHWANNCFVTSGDILRFDDGTDPILYCLSHFLSHDDQRREYDGCSTRQFEGDEGADHQVHFGYAANRTLSIAQSKHLDGIRRNHLLALLKTIDAVLPRPL